MLLHDFGRAFGHGGRRRTARSSTRCERAATRRGSPKRPRGGGRSDARSPPTATGARPHPLLPYADWAGCGPTLALAGCVIVAGCRDAGAARALGLVPSHNVAAALEMARGLAGGSHRVGVLLAPPYAPLLLGSRSVDPEVGLLDGLVRLQLGAGALERDRTDLHHVAAMRDVERHQRVLLDEQDRRARPG